MTNQVPDLNIPVIEEGPTEAERLDYLRNKLRTLGIPYSNNAGEAVLLKKIQEHEANLETPAAVVPAPAVAKTASQLRREQYLEQMKLVRVRIQNLDPKKRELPGEIITFANDVLGHVKKYVPYGEATDNGYHIPYCIYKVLKNRKFLNIKTSKNKARMTDNVRYGWVREFSIEILPPLTEDERNRLAAAQAAAGTFGVEQ